ncbi:MAG: hypothetical protein ACRD03_16665 [Acidimicrobiales bacterium]
MASAMAATCSGVTTRISGERSTPAPFSTQGFRLTMLSTTAVAMIDESSRYALATVVGPGRPARSRPARQARTRAGVSSARATSPSTGRTSRWSR